MRELKIPYKIRKYINENKNEIDNCILDAVKGCKRAELYITDLDVVVDYILDYREFSTEFYQGIINYCKDFLEKEGYYVKLFTEDPDKLDWLCELDEYNDTNFKPMMIVFSDEKDYKRNNMFDNGASLVGGLLGLITMLTES